MDAYEFGEIEQRDEVTERQIHRPPDLPFTAVAHEAASDLLPLSDGSRMLYGASTGIDVRYIPQQTSLAPFQFNQQLPFNQQLLYTTGHVQAQAPVLPEDLRQRQFAEEDLRHTVAWWGIQNLTQTFPAFPNPRETVASEAYAATGETATGFTEAHDSSNVPGYTFQIPNHGFIPNHSSSSYGLDVQSWPEQQLASTAISPNVIHNQVGDADQLDNNLLNAQVFDCNAFDHPAIGQQLPINPMVLATSYGNIGPTGLDPYNHGDYTSSFVDPTQYHYPQPSLPLQAVGPVVIPSSQLPTYMTNNMDYGNAHPVPATPIWHENDNPPASYAFATKTHELPPVVDTSRMAMNNIDSTDDTGPLVATRAIRGKTKHGKGRQSVSASPYQKNTRPGREMNNVIFHTDPEAYRQQQKYQPIVYSRRPDRSGPSCFGCRYSKNKRKCETLTGDICLECLKILRKHYDRTAIPKFTCDVRTKFSDISIFVDVPPKELADRTSSKASIIDLSHPLELEFDDGLPSMTISGKIQEKDMLTVCLRILRRVKPLLDFLEPLNIRKLFEQPDHGHPNYLWAYSFGLLRWESAIRFFWPGLKDALDLHKQFHRLIHQGHCEKLDRLVHSTLDDSKLVYFNMWYEGLSTMEDTSMVNIAGKQHFLSSLTHHILHMYRMRYPITLARNKSMWKHDRIGASGYYNAFPLTSRLLPAAYRCLPNGGLAWGLIQVHDEQSTSESTKMAVANSTSSQEPPKETERPTAKCIPASLQAMFGLDIVTSCIEELALKDVRSLPMRSDGKPLIYSSWALSLAFRAFMVQYDIKRCTHEQKVQMLVCTIMSSRFIRKFCRDFHRRSSPSTKGATFREIIMTKGATLGEIIMTYRDRLEVIVIEHLTSCNFFETITGSGKFEEGLRRASR